ncbi:RICIN domain-containing protein [Pelagibacteraceae bacterium]|nr:RICIN domain-containing protein [Pelagibacteraceae bacterium]MDC0365926.1 RICIN domain-containing protein [Pelagibacteraceae bacterium]
MKKIFAIIVLSLLFITPSQVNDSIEIYLLNQLDDSRGFCIDIKGHKLNAQINKGLQAHTCYSYQGEISPDQGFNSLKLTKNQFFLPVFNTCMEASSLTPSAELRLRKCNRNKLQNFEWSNKKQIRLISNRKLCLTVDQGQSKKGGGGTPVHLMRNLSLELCSKSLNPYQAWGVRK